MAWHGGGCVYAAGGKYAARRCDDAERWCHIPFGDATVVLKFVHVRLSGVLRVPFYIYIYLLQFTFFAFLST